jgi:outer membrane protein, heavy metal efflux system
MKINNHFIPVAWCLLAIVQAANIQANEGGYLSLTQLVAAVLQANPELEVAHAVWQAYASRVEQQSSLADPKFRYSLAPLTIGSDKIHFGQRFELSQQIPWPGKLSLRGKAAEYAAQASQQNTLALQLVLATAAKSLFADWYFIHQAIAINQINQSLLTEFRDIAVSRYSTGQVSKQDALGAEVELNLLRHQAIVLQRERKTILAHINTLLNQPPEMPIPVPQKLAEINFIPDIDELRAEAMQSRPELKGVAANVQAAKTTTELAELSYYPDFKLSAGYNGLWDNEDKRFTIGVGINIPLDQSKRQAAEQEARAKMQQAHWHKIDLEAKIIEELQIAYDRVVESLHTLKLYREQLAPLADENLAAAKADYRAGKGDFLTLLNSEKNLMQTQLQTEQALADTHRRFAALERAVGSIESLWGVEPGSTAP